MDYRWLLTIPVVVVVIVVGGTLFPLRHSPVAFGAGLLGWTFIVLAGLGAWKSFQDGRFPSREDLMIAVLAGAGLFFLRVLAPALI